MYSSNIYQDCYDVIEPCIKNRKILKASRPILKIVVMAKINYEPGRLIKKFHPWFYLQILFAKFRV